MRKELQVIVPGVVGLATLIIVGALVLPPGSGAKNAGGSPAATPRRAFHRPRLAHPADQCSPRASARLPEQND